MNPYVPVTLAGSTPTYLLIHQLNNVFILWEFVSSISAQPCHMFGVCAGRLWRCPVVWQVAGGGAATVPPADLAGRERQSGLQAAARGERVARWRRRDTSIHTGPTWAVQGGSGDCGRCVLAENSTKSLWVLRCQNKRAASGDVPDPLLPPGA